MHCRLQILDADWRKKKIAHLSAVRLRCVSKDAELNRIQSCSYMTIFMFKFASSYVGR
jgi:hypothetical protein